MLIVVNLVANKTWLHVRVGIYVQSTLNSTNPKLNWCQEIQCEHRSCITFDSYGISMFQSGKKSNTPLPMYPFITVEHSSACSSDVCDMTEISWGYLQEINFWSLIKLHLQNSPTRFGTSDTLDFTTNPACLCDWM